MRKMMIIIVVLSVYSITFNACNKGYVTKISKYNTDDSHNNGLDCMKCHNLSGTAEGWFTAAGTVYSPDKINIYPNGTIKLFTKSNSEGNLVATIEVDANGNFYTTEKIDFSNGLYPVITGTHGTEKEMLSAATSGSCNSCHGNTTGKLWAED